MKAPDVAEYILRSCPTLSGFQAYMFGSSLYGVGSDFDILIVGQSGDKLTQLKIEMKVAGSELPLDVLYMLPEEAEETNFVAKQHCITFEQLCKIANGHLPQM